jgi:hypothetical protein
MVVTGMVTASPKGAKKRKRAVYMREYRQRKREATQTQEVEQKVQTSAPLAPVVSQLQIIDRVCIPDREPDYSHYQKLQRQVQRYELVELEYDDESIDQSVELAIPTSTYHAEVLPAGYRIDEKRIIESRPTPSYPKFVEHNPYYLLILAIAQFFKPQQPRFLSLFPRPEGLQPGRYQPVAFLSPTDQYLTLATPCGPASHVNLMGYGARVEGEPIKPRINFGHIPAGGQPSPGCER